MEKLVCEGIVVVNAKLTEQNYSDLKSAIRKGLVRYTNAVHRNVFPFYVTTAQGEIAVPYGNHPCLSTCSNCRRWVSHP